MRSLVYSVPIQTRDQLLQRILHFCEEIKNKPEMIRAAILNLNRRQEKCREAEGLQFENML